MTTNDPVAVASYGTRAEAVIAQMTLERAGIDSYAAEGNIATWLSHAAIGVGGVELLVRKEDFEQARQVLGARKDVAPEDETDALSEHEAAAVAAWRAAWLSLAFFAILFWLLSFYYMAKSLAGPLTDDARMKLRVAVVIDVIGIALSAVFWFLVLSA